MGFKYLVKNRLNSSFGILFSILYGLVLSDHLKNTVQLFIDHDSISAVGLSLSIFFFMSFSAFEAFIDFDFQEGVIESTDVYKKLLTYLIWFLQFIPLYAMTFVLGRTDLSENQMSRFIAASFGMLYAIYWVYQMVEFIIAIKRNKKSKRNEAAKHLIFYSVLSGLYWVFYSFIMHIRMKHSYVQLTVMIIILTLIYVIYWRNYFLKVLFKRHNFKS